MVPLFASKVLWYAAAVTAQEESGTSQQQPIVMKMVQKTLRLSDSRLWCHKIGTHYLHSIDPKEASMFFYYMYSIRYH
jgi:hypothetical protein